LLEHVERRKAGRRDGGRMGGAEEERARAMVEVLDQALRAADVSSQDADRLGERANLDVDLAVQVEMIHRAAAGLPQDSARMRVVDHHDRAVRPRARGNRAESCYVAVHAEAAVRDREPALEVACLLSEPLPPLDAPARQEPD